VKGAHLALFADCAERLVQRLQPRQPRLQPRHLHRRLVRRAPLARGGGAVLCTGIGPRVGLRQAPLRLADLHSRRPGGLILEDRLGLRTEFVRAAF
jgi:hypothetical protein